jgi:hypothetical protein
MVIHKSLMVQEKKHIVHKKPFYILHTIYYFSSIAPISVHAAFEKVSIKHKKYSRVWPFPPPPLSHFQHPLEKVWYSIFEL